jgi:hypothetical protein
MVHDDEGNGTGEAYLDELGRRLPCVDYLHSENGFDAS